MATIITIDPGHGGNTGACYAGVIEDEVVFFIAKHMTRYLIEYGCVPILTRNEELIPLGRRGKIAIKNKSNLFISLHANSSNNPDACGTEIYYVRDSKYHEQSIKIANKILHMMASAGWTNRGIKPDYQSQHSKLRVLRDTCNYMPALLVEVGFLSNPMDRKYLSDDLCREKIAKRIAKACIAGLNMFTD